MAFDPDKFLAETSGASTAAADFDPDAFLKETAPAQDFQDQPRPIGIVRAAQDIAQTPGKMIDAARAAAEQGGQHTVVKNAQGRLVSRSIPGQILNGLSTAANVVAAPFIAGANQGIKTISDAFSNPYNGQGLLEPLSDQNIANYAQKTGIPLDKIAQLPDVAEKALGEEAYRNLSDIGNIGLNLVPGIAGLKGAGTLGEAAIRGTAGKAADVLANASDRFLSGELKIKQSLAKSGYGGNIMDKKQGILETVKKYNTPTNNFDDVSNGLKNGSQAIDASRLSIYDKKPEIISDLNPDAISNPVDILKKSYSMTDPSVKGAAAWGKTPAAKKIIDDILADAEDAGANKPMNAEQLMAIRERLNPDGELFKNGAFLSNADNLEMKIRKSMYFNVLDEVEKAVPELRPLGREEKRLIDAKAVIDDARSRISNKYPVSFADWATMWAGRAAGIGGMAEGAHLAGASTPVAIAGGAAAYGLKKAGEQGRAAAVLGNLSDAARWVAGPQKGPALPDRVGWNQSGEGPTLANMTQQPAQSPHPEPASYPTLGTLSQGDPYQNLLTPQQYKEMQKGQRFNVQAQSLNAEDYPDFNPDQLKTPDEHFMDQSYMGGFKPEQAPSIDAIANKWKMDFKKSFFPGRFEDVNYSKLNAEDQKRVRIEAEDANTDPERRKELIENGIIKPDQNVHYNDVINWANEGGHVTGKGKGPTLGNMFNGNLGSGVNIGMPMTTRAGLGGMYGYVASDPNATPEEKMRNMLMGAAGGAFMPTIGRMLGRKAEGAPGALMAPPGVGAYDTYIDEAAALRAKKIGLNYTGSSNKGPEVPKEQHWFNDDLGTGSSFIVPEDKSVAEALDAHRRRFWGKNYDDKMQGFALDQKQKAQIEDLKKQYAQKDEVHPEDQLSPDEIMWNKNNEKIDKLKNLGYIYDEEKQKYVPSDKAGLERHWSSFGSIGQGHPRSPIDDSEIRAKSRSFGRESGKKSEADKKVSPKTNQDENKSSTLGSL